MRTEYKEITIKQEVYISDDGKEFVDEDECLDHEFKVLGQQIECYDYNGSKVDDPENCSVVNLGTEDDVERFIHWSDICGCTTDGIDKPGRGVGITCDGCGEEIFIDEKDLGTHEFGWLHIKHSIDYSEVDFCPTCARAYKDTLYTFMNSRKIIKTGKMLRKGFEDGIKGLRESGEEEATDV